MLLPFWHWVEWFSFLHSKFKCDFTESDFSNRNNLLPSREIWSYWLMVIKTPPSPTKQLQRYIKLIGDQLKIKQLRDVMIKTSWGNNAQSIENKRILHMIYWFNSVRNLFQLSLTHRGCKCWDMSTAFFKKNHNKRFHFGFRTKGKAEEKLSQKKSWRKVIYIIDEKGGWYLT